jgi:hypothetical protein
VGVTELLVAAGSSGVRVGTGVAAGELTGLTGLLFDVVSQTAPAPPPARTRTTSRASHQRRTLPPSLACLP